MNRVRPLPSRSAPGAALAPRSCLLGALLGLSACGPEPVDTAGTGTLPEETGDINIAYDTSTYGLETGLPSDTANEEPDAVLHMEQTGEWILGPAGGPWTTISGTLDVYETYPESGRDNCSASYALSGTSTDQGCESCTDAFVVTFVFTDGNSAPCRDSDLPAVDEERTFGWAPEELTIYLNYHDTGAWVPWYDATAEGDTLHVRWEADVGVAEGM